MGAIYAVCWTKRSGRTAQFHYLNRAVAEQTAANFRRGWRKDARVVAQPEWRPLLEWAVRNLKAVPTGGAILNMGPIGPRQH